MTDDGKVTVPADGFLRRTGQLWKLVVGGIVVPIPTALFAVLSLRRIRPDQPFGEVAWSIGLLAAGAALVVAVLASVRCPRCRVRLVRQAFADPQGAQAIPRLLAIYTCPACGFDPRTSTR
jgi:uncharacterized integral membrane protein